MSQHPTTPEVSNRIPRAQSPVTLEKKEDVEEMSNLNSRLERYLVKVRDLGKQNEELKEKLENIRKSKRLGPEDQDEKQLKDKLVALEKEKKTLDDGIKELDAKKEIKKGAIDRLKGTIADDADKLKELDHEILALNQEIGHLRDRPKNFDPRRLQEIQLLKEKIRDKDAEIEDLKEHEKDQLQKALEKEKQIWDIQEEDEIKDLTSFYQSKLAELKKREEDLHLEKKRYETKKREAAHHVAELKDKLKRLQGERDRLLVEYDKIREDELLPLTLATEQRNNEVKALENEIARKNRDFGALERANTEFREEINQYKRILEQEESRISLGVPETKKRRINETSPESTPSSTAEHGPQQTEAPVSFAVTKSGKVQIDDVTAAQLKISNLTTSDINMSGWFIQAQPSSNPNKIQRFKFPETCDVLPGDGSLIVKVLSDDRHEPLEAKLYGPGSTIQILDDNDYLVSQIDIIEDPNKTGCLVM